MLVLCQGTDYSEPSKQMKDPRIYSVPAIFIEDLKHQFNCVSPVPVLVVLYSSSAWGEHCTIFVSTILFSHSDIEALFFRSWMDFWLSMGRWRMSNKVIVRKFANECTEGCYPLFLVGWVNSWEK